MGRHNNKLPDNILQLQNVIKCDPESYKEEFLQQQQHYLSLMAVFQLRPDQPNKKLSELVMFMAHVAHCYTDLLTDFAQQLITLLQTHNTVLSSVMRQTFCKALILLRNKRLLEPTDLLSLFFQLLRCQDKSLRKFLELSIVNDIRKLNRHHKNVKLNSHLQNFMFSMMNENNARAAKMSVNILIQLYKKNVWNDAKTVNLITLACFSKVIKVMVAAIQFFTTVDPVNESDDEESEKEEPNYRAALKAYKITKKTRKRTRKLEKIKTLAAKAFTEKHYGYKKVKNLPTYNFSALHLIHDPQGFAEKLFRHLQATHERFEVRLMVLNLISRLIGVHQLLLLNFYPYIQRFLQPHQKEVVQLLQFVAQASHELVPPDVLEPVLRTLVNNFVTERNSVDVMAVGLNAIRELCVRCPLVMTKDLLQDLAAYKNYRNKSVSVAAKSIILTFRVTYPQLLRRKDRGRPSEAMIGLQAKQFGESQATDYIPGAEVLNDPDTEPCRDADDESSDGEWVDMPEEETSKDIGEEKKDCDADDDDDDFIEIEEEEEEEDEDGETSKEGEGETSKEGESLIQSASEIKKLEKPAAPLNATARNQAIISEKRKQAAEVSLGRLLTDEDFERIRFAEQKKKTEPMRPGTKRQYEEVEGIPTNRNELVPLSKIEMIHKKRKDDKQTRIESIRKGQEGREKFGYKDGRLDPFSSKTNREKNRNKNFMMVRHKARGKTIKKSFRDKQIALRNFLIKQHKMR